MLNMVQKYDTRRNNGTLVDGIYGIDTVFYWCQYGINGFGNHVESLITTD